MRTLLACVLVFGALPALAAEPPAQPLPFDPGRWTLSGDMKIETYMGRTALRMRSGEAVAKDVEFLDGTVEFDLAVGTRRNFPMIGLRRQGEGEYEEFYLRTHKSELPDAIQYVPAYQGVGGWQLYHGPGFTARASFARNEWMPVRIVMSGTKAAVFIGAVTEPQLVVQRLRREPKAGGLELSDSSPGAPEGEFTAAISNLVLRPGFVPYDFSKSTTKENAPPSGVVTEWQISAPFEPAKGPIRRLPEDVVSGRWQTVAAEPSGLVVLERFIPLLKAVERPAALAKLIIDSPSARIRRFDFGYSDEVTVFLNGQPLFTGDAHYSHDNPRQEGLIGFWQGTLYLPLKKGRNELVLAVAEVFGGWGLMGRLEENPSADARLATATSPREDLTRE